MCMYTIDNVSLEMDKDQVGTVIVVRHKDRYYDHYGILDGQDGVIHVNKKLGTITVDPLDRVIRNATKVTYLDDDFETRWKTYTRAKKLIGSKHNYRFLTDNCEVWVNKVRTGEAFSRQLDGVTSSLAMMILGIAAISELGKTLGE